MGKDEGMALHHLTVTLTGAAQALATPAAGSPPIAAQWLRIESEGGNADVKVGQSTITATDYGGIVAAGAASALTMIASQGLPIVFSSIYVIGTVSQKIHLLYIT